MTRRCGCEESAIEFGQSRITLQELEEALRTIHESTKDAIEARVHPSQDYLQGAKSGLQMTSMPKGLDFPLHSPWHFEVGTDRGRSYRHVYKLEQGVQTSAGKGDISWRTHLILSPFRGLNLYENVLDPETLQTIREWLSGFPVNGGLWICPYIPLVSDYFRTAILKNLKGLCQDGHHHHSFGCRVCGAAFHLSRCYYRVITWYRR